MESWSSSPYINRFLSADTIVPGYANPQNLNRFSYMLNNPLRYVDPTGHMVDNGCSLGCSSISTSNYCATHPAACNQGTGGGGGNGGNSSESGGDNNGRHSDENDSGIPATDLTPAERGQDHNCAFGWVSALLTPDGSCGNVTVHSNAIVDPLTWEHIAGATLGGVAMVAFSAMVMIPMGVELCTSIVGCAAGIPLVGAGVLGIGVGGVLVYSGVKFTQKYLDDIFEVTPQQRSH